MNRSGNATRHNSGGRTRLCALALLAAFLLTGCASKYGEQTTKVNHYPDCYQPIADLRSSEHLMNKSVGTGIALGALLGGVIGYLATGKASGAVAGAGVGAVAGGAAGYGVGKSRQAELDRRMDGYMARMDADIATVDKATGAARAARGCYERQFRVASAEYRAGNLSKAQFRSRTDEILAGMEEASRIIGEISMDADKVSQEYQAAIDRDRQAAQQPQPQTQQSRTRQNVPAPAPVAPSPEKERAVNAKSKSMEKSVDALKNEQALLDQRVKATRQASEDLMTT